jgi:hypothetical protein
MEPTIAISNPDDPGGKTADAASALSGELVPPETLELMLVGSVGNRFVVSDQPATIEVPSNIFRSTNLNEKLAYEAHLPDGSPLPNWLTFDPRNLTFRGTPPDSARGAVDIVIVAKDTHANTAEAQFKILVGRNTGNDAPVHEGSRPHGAQTPSPRGSNGPLGPAGERHGDAGPTDGRHAELASPFFASLTRGVEPVGRPSFTTQLQQAAHHGRVAAARALIDAFRIPSA